MDLIHCPGVGLYTEDIDKKVEAEELFADLIEQAYLAGIITGETQELAFFWVATNQQTVH